MIGKAALIERLKSGKYTTSDLSWAETCGLIRRVKANEIGTKKNAIKAFLGVSSKDDQK